MIPTISPPAESFDQKIERAVKRSDVFAFLISPDSVAQGRYTLTELSFARRKWPNPSGRVLPVMIRKTSPEQIPPYLKAVTILEPRGNIAAETSAAVDNMKVGRRPNPWLVGPRLAPVLFARRVLFWVLQALLQAQTSFKLLLR